jgi:hypothetical protein
MKGRVLAAGTNRVVILNPDGGVSWEHPAALVHDTWMLPNGNVLFADGLSVAEVTMSHDVVFRYQAAEQHGGGTYTCQRLENGSTVVGENSTGRMLELDRAGRIVFTLQTAPSVIGAHHNMRMARKLENGNYLVCHSGANLVKEYDATGKVVWELKTPNLPFAAVRTDHRTTVVSTLDHITEYDAVGNVVWQFANTDAPQAAITNMTGLHLLADGAVAVGCYRAYNGRSGSALFEISRDRKLIWRYANPGGDSSMMAIQRLDESGKALPGRCLR